MAKIKDLDVTVTYCVGLGDLDVPDAVLEELKIIADSGREINDEFDYSKYPNAIEWVKENITQDDCYEWKLGIDNLE